MSRLRGMDSETGIPTDGGLAYLDLDWLINDKPAKGNCSGNKKQ